MKIHNPFGRLSNAEGEAKLQSWLQSYNRTFDGNVYHYTSAASLLGILSSQSLYCTDYRQLNDSTELATGIEVVEALLAARGEAFGIPDQEIADALDHLALLRRCAMHVSMYAASFSFHKNDLTQWRSYAPTYGVSIGFRLSVLQRLAEQQHFVCGPVRYLGAPRFHDWLIEQLASMKEGLEKAAENERALRKNATPGMQEHLDLTIRFQRSGNLERWVCEVAGLLKNPDFRSESEWRCVFVHRQNTNQPQKSTKFRSASPKALRFVELDFSHADLNELIAEVVIGPGVACEETFHSTTEILRSYGLLVPVSLPHHALR